MNCISEIKSTFITSLKQGLSVESRIMLQKNYPFVSTQWVWLRKSSLNNSTKIYYMKNIAVIGSGTMGNGIAHAFAQNGFKVSLIDISEEALKKGMASIEKNLSRQVEKGTITEELKKQAIANLTTHTFLKE